MARRYRCTACAAVHLVVPRGVLPWLRYSAGAILLALAMWALEGHAAHRVRKKVSPFPNLSQSVLPTWPTLRRWAKRPPWSVQVAARTPRRRAAEVARSALARSPLSAQEHGIRPRIFAAAAQFD